MEMTRKPGDIIDSPIFGPSVEPSEAERQAIADLLKSMPVAVFQELNRCFNQKGLCIQIISLREVH
jgi:hypothetical protein